MIVVDRGQTVVERRGGESPVVRTEEIIGADYERFNIEPRQGRDGGFDFVLSSRARDMKVQSEHACCGLMVVYLAVPAAAGWVYDQSHDLGARQQLADQPNPLRPNLPPYATPPYT